ncbi:MAG: type II toxin-antitoxin system HicB family antitoxin [Deltaproteobacteria bacterium]|nr:MAG: type II toxin-antitoxin system HicB family antitoxin [Deltaproteobacteria bacterium]
MTAGRAPRNDRKYKRDSKIGCVVAIAPVLPGCMTQGDNFEEARDNLIDAIELWITVGLREGEEMPLINGARLVTATERIEKPQSALYRV